MNTEVRSKSVGQMIKESEEAAFQEKLSAFRHPILTIAQVRERLTALARGQVWWLDKFTDGRAKRPDHEIDTHRQHLAALVQASDLLKGVRNEPEPGR